MTNLVHQYTKGDCAIATLAMYCNRSYQQAWDAFRLRTGRERADGTHFPEISLLAKDLGKRIRRGWGRPSGKSLLLIRIAESDFSHPIACGDRTWYHAVYYDGANIFDPSMNNSITTCLTTKQYLDRVVCWYKDGWMSWRKNYE
jgi:hypothetical protein